jgi:hypothetical protein
MMLATLVGNSFLDYEQVAIRKEAAVTCCKLIPKFAESVRYGQTTLMIFEMLRRLVVVGIADSVCVCILMLRLPLIVISYTCA